MDSDRDDVPRTWGQRNGLTIILVVMAVMFVVVIVVQKMT